MAIPASQTVNVVPSVISPGGTQLAMIGLMLTSNPRLPYGAVQPFPNAAAVSAYFGPTSPEAQTAIIYFGGYYGSTARPGSILFSQTPLAQVPAYVRGATVAGMSITALQGITGVLTVLIDGTALNTGAVNLSAATSPSAAAALITTALATANATPVTTGTGSISGASMIVTAGGSVYPGSVAPTNPSGPGFCLGQVMGGTGIAAGTIITGLGTGLGGVGTYTVTPPQTVTSTAITGSIANPICTYDSISQSYVITSATSGFFGSSVSIPAGSLAIRLMLSALSGAIASPGTAPQTFGTYLSNIQAVNNNWVSITTLFEPTLIQKLQVATWIAGQNNNYLYAMWDTNTAPTAAGDNTSAGYQIIQAAQSGIAPIYQDSNLGPALCGWIASLDFSRQNGRTTMAFRSAGNLTPSVTTSAIQQALVANGYNCYASNATAAQQFNYFTPGSVTGPFRWIDSYICQIQLNNAIQSSMMALLNIAPSIPYNLSGYGLIRGAAQGPIDVAVNFGTIRSGVVLSPLQASEVNAQAGLAIDTVLSARGWYLQILDPGAVVRAARGTPVITLWYMDGQSVQTITIASVNVQ